MAGEAQCLSYTGCNFLRQRLVLATLSGRPLKIRKIRAKEEDPGLRGERRHPRPRGGRSGAAELRRRLCPGLAAGQGQTPLELGQPGLRLRGPHQEGGPGCIPVDALSPERSARPARVPLSHVGRGALGGGGARGSGQGGERGQGRAL